MATRTTVRPVIDEFRTTYNTNVERGEAFEKLMAAYFRLDPTLAAEHDLVRTPRRFSTICTVIAPEAVFTFLRNGLTPPILPAR